ncbi:SmpA / OmlA family protein [Holospora obtusa F1]|uniref:SmpA / OmlA family protein n=1 Tax=Holospora obtusa F1 TaxID=1399147 RepID=W6TDB1_HOLOB|nr:outer membrane protein assembly factor BamE [Holospora obtusa]ETZ06978.1 SmpA / OmlA family protein [Holospora obtusa F1]
MIIIPKKNSWKALVFGLLLCGCEPERNVRGRVIPEEDLAQVKNGLGVLDQTQIEQLIGPPSSILSFDPHTWYYLNFSTETKAFFAPLIKENKGFALIFSNNGKLAKYIPNSGTKSLEIALKETTLPSTHRKEFLKELFRNAGRFGKKAKGNRQKS